jgi:hypothetical protein
MERAIGIRNEKFGLIPDLMKLNVLMHELKKIRDSEVAITTCGGRNSKKVYRVGTINIPPPTPKNEENTPTRIPVITSPKKIIFLKSRGLNTRCIVATCVNIIKIDIKEIL